MKKIVIMKKVDELILTQMNSVSDSAGYQKFLDIYNTWEDNVQSLFKGGVLITLFLIPMLIIFSIWILNNSARERVAIQEEIIKTASTILEESTEVRQITRKYFGRDISTKSAFENTLRQSLPSLGIDTNKLMIGDFDIQEDAGINQVTAQIKFNALSSDNLLGLLSSLTIRSKMKLEQILIKKNTQSNLLEGTATIHHYSKVIVSEN